MCSKISQLILYIFEDSKFTLKIYLNSLNACDIDMRRIIMTNNLSTNRPKKLILENFLLSIFYLCFMIVILNVGMCIYLFGIIIININLYNT